MNSFLYEDSPLRFCPGNSSQDAGSHIDEANVWGMTPLLTAIDRRKIGAASWLVDHGADLSPYNEFGNSALSWAVKKDCHKVLKLLLENGLDHTSTIDPDGTLMHLAAGSSDLDTLKLLQQGHLARRDINAKNKKGQTPYQVALHRQDVDEQWMLAFGNWLRAIDREQPAPPDAVRNTPVIITDIMAEARPHWESDAEELSSDEFEDAVESQPPSTGTSYPI